MVLLCLVLAGPAAHAQALYWIDKDFASPKLGRADLDGSNATYVALPGQTLPEGVALDPSSDHLYFVESAISGARVRRASTQTLGSLTDLVTGGSACRGIDLDLTNGKIYWTSSNQTTGSSLHRANLDGSLAEVLYTDPLGNFRDVEVDPASDRVFVADYTGQILQLDLAGTLNVSLAAPHVWGLALDAGNNTMYYTDYAAGEIRVGSFLLWFSSPVVTGLGHPTHLDIDLVADKLYWSEAAIGAQKVQRANQDGSVIEDLGLPMAAYGGVTLGPNATVSVPGDTQDEAVTEFALGAPSPNPARGTTRIRYAVPQQSRVSLAVFDVQGREVATLFDGIREPGRYSVAWNGSGTHGRAPSGLYFVRFSAPDRDRVVRVVLQR
jgi:sugar lactone lactonase YvrE